MNVPDIDIQPEDWATASDSFKKLIEKNKVVLQRAKA
jgi:hypothetical protein